MKQIQIQNGLGELLEGRMYSENECERLGLGSQAF